MSGTVMGREGGIDREQKGKKLRDKRKKVLQKI